MIRVEVMNGFFKTQYFGCKDVEIKESGVVNLTLNNDKRVTTHISRCIIYW